MTRPPDTIDLGVLLPEEAEQARMARRIEAEPWWAGWRDDQRRPWVRWAAATALVGVLPLASVGGAMPDRPFATLENTIQLGFDARATFDNHRLYAVASSEAGGGRSALTAYLLPGGEVAWEMALADGSSSGSLVGIVDGTLLLYGGGPVGVGTTALDPASGRELWHHRGWALVEIDGWVLLEARSVGPHIGPDGEVDRLEPALHLTLVEAATGRIGWQHRSERTSRVAVGDSQQPYLVIREGDGTLTTHDLTTGGELASAPGPATHLTQLLVSHSLVLLAEQVPDGTRVTAYAVGDLSHEWSVTLPPETMVETCGEMVCGHLPGAVVRLLDPMTGQVLRTERLDLLRLTPEHVADLGTLLAAGAGEAPLDQGRWWLAPTGPGPYGPPSSSADLATRQVDGAVWLGEIRTDGSGIDPVGRLDNALRSCTTVATYTVCLGDRLREAQIWRVHW